MFVVRINEPKFEYDIHSIVKAFYPEVPLIVDAKGCAGVNVQSHLNALEAMKMCQVKVIGE